MSRRLRIESLEDRRLLSVSAPDVRALPNGEMLEVATDFHLSAPLAPSGDMATGDANSSDQMPLGNPVPTQSDYEYVIITSGELESSFHPLVNQKLSRGISAEIFTTEYIYANYSGTENNDQADKIRSFIRHSYLNHGTQWVLLGGDVDVIPVRRVYVATPLRTVTDLATDEYYACLDGPWNGDGDDYWGEFNDGTNGYDIDLVPEVYVGRAPVSNAAEAANFVQKTIMYETVAAPQANKAIVVGDKLDSSNYGSGSGDDIIENVLPPDWQSQVQTRYDTPAPFSWSSADLINDLNASPHIVTHLGHGSVTSMGYGRLTNAIVDGLSNAFPFVMYSQACDMGNFTYSDAIGEHLVFSAHGAVAVLMNTEFGWYSTSGGLDLNHLHAKAFWDAIFNQGKIRLGEANAAAKAWMRANVGRSGYYRWIQLTTNLLGDPETPFQLDGLPANRRPTGIALSSTSVEEFQPPGTIVGVFSSTDPDAGDAFTYSFVVGDGSGDNGAFLLDGNELKTAVEFDAATQASYSIRVRTTDQGGLWFEEIFEITVTSGGGNQGPSVTGVTVTDTLIADADTGDGKTFTVTIGFSGPMDAGSEPELAFVPWHQDTLTGGAGGWTDETTFVVSYGVADKDVDIRDIQIGISGGKDLVGNLQEPFAAERAFSIDTRNPVVVSLIPSHGTTNAAPDADLLIVLDEAVEKGAGNIVLRKLADDSVVEAIDVSSPAVTVSQATVTIRPASMLDLDTAHYVEIDSGAFTDLAGNRWEGFSGSGQWSFTTTIGSRIEMTIVRQPTATDGSGELASLPASADWVHEWESFWVEIWVSTPDTTTLRVVGATVDLQYDNEYLTAQEIVHGPAFTLDPAGTIEDALGLVGGIGGRTELTDVGDSGYVLLARVRFASTGDDQVPVDEVGRKIGPYDMQMALGNGQTVLVGGSSSVSELVESPGTQLWAVMYDIDDTHRIDFGDLAFFAPAFGKEVGPAGSEPPFAWWADFDKSNRVDFGDLAFLAPNFGTSRDGVQSGNETLVFPPGFPSAWSGQLGSDSLGEAEGFAVQTMAQAAQQVTSVSNSWPFGDMPWERRDSAPAVTAPSRASDQVRLGVEAGSSAPFPGSRSITAEYEPSGCWSERREPRESLLAVFSEQSLDPLPADVLASHDTLFALLGQ